MEEDRTKGDGVSGRLHLQIEDVQEQEIKRNVKDNGILELTWK